jgi:hypothetical protein
MSEHRPTLGSRVRAWRTPLGAGPECLCGAWWPCPATIEGQRVWQTGSPIPDAVPMDFIQTAKGLYQVAHGGAR